MKVKDIEFANLDSQVWTRDISAFKRLGGNIVHGL